MGGGGAQYQGQPVQGDAVNQAEGGLLRLDVQGVSSHAAMPEKGVNAASRALELLAKASLGLSDGELALVRAHCAREEARLAQRMEEEKGRGALENALRALAEGEEGRPILPALLAQLRLLPGRKVEVALRGQPGIWKFQGEK